jgi:hypothetical protein
MKRSRWPNKPIFRKTALDGPDHNGFEAVIEENYPVVFLGDLLAKFYQHNYYEYAPVQPIAVHMEAGETEGREEGWWFVYYHRFLIHIEQHYSSKWGPHIARLLYKSEYAPRIHWIATLQIQAFFFSEEELSLHLFSAIRHRRFFIAPFDAKRIVIL